MPKIVDLTNLRFGKLTVIRKHDEKDNYGRFQWICLCDCGKQSIVRGQNLTGGSTRSCGCLNTTHDCSHLAEYRIWCSMLHRCYNEKNIAYHRYGGRGITVCEEWRNSFEAFYRDMGPRPSPDYSVDRIKGDKGYEAGNCRWATAVEQNNNRSDNLRYKFDGETKSLAEWCREFGLKYDRIRYLILRKGLSLEDAINDGGEQNRR